MKYPITFLFAALIPLVTSPAAMADDTTWDELYNRQVNGQQSQAPVQQENSQFATQSSNQSMQNGQMQAQNHSSNGMQSQSGMQNGQNFQNRNMQNNMQASQSTPVLNSALAQQMRQFNENNPKGVDILDESMKYHNNGCSNNFTTPNMMMNGNASYGQMMPQNGTMIGGNQMATPCYSLNNCTVVMPGAAMPNQMQMQNGMSGNGLNTQAIGVMGAAALMGVYLQNGGLGGMLKSVGWDNKFHISGQSIGGY